MTASVRHVFVHLAINLVETVAEILMNVAATLAVVKEDLHASTRMEATNVLPALALKATSPNPATAIAINSSAQEETPNASTTRSLRISGSTPRWPTVFNPMAFLTITLSTSLRTTIKFTTALLQEIATMLSTWSRTTTTV